MRRHSPTAARIALIGAFALAIGAAAGFAQAKTDTPSQAGTAQRPALVQIPACWCSASRPAAPRRRPVYCPR